MTQKSSATALMDQILQCIRVCPLDVFWIAPQIGKSGASLPIILLPLMLLIPVQQMLQQIAGNRYHCFQNGRIINSMVKSTQSIGNARLMLITVPLDPVYGLQNALHDCYYNGSEPLILSI